MSLTDPIDCLPIPWSGGACVPAVTATNPSEWINILTIDQLVALWAKVETFSLNYDIDARVQFTNNPSEFDAASRVGTLVMDSNPFSPVSRICGMPTVNPFEANESGMDTTEGFSPLGGLVAYVSCEIRFDLNSVALGVRRVLDTSGNLLGYTTPLRWEVRAVMSSVTDLGTEPPTFYLQQYERRFVCFTGNPLTPLYPVPSDQDETELSSGTIDVAGVTLQWSETEKTWSGATNNNLVPLDPQPSVDPSEYPAITNIVNELSFDDSATEWTFDGTIN